jgi:hypothetical protein
VELWGIHIYNFDYNPSAGNPWTCGSAWKESDHYSGRRWEGTCVAAGARDYRRMGAWSNPALSSRHGAASRISLRDSHNCAAGGSARAFAEHTCRAPFALEMYFLIGFQKRRDPFQARCFCPFHADDQCPTCAPTTSASFCVSLPQAHPALDRLIVDLLAPGFIR